MQSVLVVLVTNVAVSVGGSESIDQLHGVSTNRDGGSDVDIGKGTSSIS